MPILKLIMGIFYTQKNIEYKISKTQLKKNLLKSL